MEYDQVGVIILRKESLSSLNKVFSIIRAKERIILMVKSSTMDESTFATVKPNSNPFNLRSGATIEGGRSNQPRPQCNKDNLGCNYYKKPRHTKENCQKLQTKPQFFSRNNGNYNAQFEKRSAYANIVDSKNSSYQENAIPKTTKLVDSTKKRLSKFKVYLHH